MARPSALAVFTLTTSSNVVGCTMTGLDAVVAPGFVAGFAVGGGGANTFAGTGVTALCSALQVALYGEYAAGSFFLDGQAAYLYFDQATTRPLGAWNSVARGGQTTSGTGGQAPAATS